MPRSSSSSSSSSSKRRSRRHQQRAQQQQQNVEASLVADMRSPAGWYPLARAMQRQLIAHMGPTNSGKTHAALTALMAAPSGVYCGPLRLLACEVADRLNAAGVPCSLVTGQEVRLVPGARHAACTVEMADVERRVEVRLQVAVLDEVQMIADKSRGWSWTRVLLGMPAQQLHLCGDPAAAGLLQELAGNCADTLTVQRYKRLSPLVVEPRALQGLAEVQQGDAVVAFGRKALHKLRRNILKSSSRSRGDGWDGGQPPPQQLQHCVGMVYGALPPEARRMQAALFNAGPGVSPRYSVLVASDAIGMGLNLNIRRVVFATMHKYDGQQLRPLTPTEVKQIAGRAGRFGGAHAAGYVTCLSQSDLPLLRQSLATASEEVADACLLPRFEQLEAFARCAPRTLPFHELLSSFADSRGCPRLLPGRHGQPGGPGTHAGTPRSTGRPPCNCCCCCCWRPCWWCWPC
ncbi:P-loop containing nucleoside triphosphate hydrolase protein [Scenedesmus sp. NREL 46B-D3]|nr:P-loop containing nucleoside triphosphate hydrolase protein [Scenedesmus sp. NREL 46B-D3]